MPCWALQNIFLFCPKKNENSPLSGNFYEFYPLRKFQINTRLARWKSHEVIHSSKCEKVLEINSDQKCCKYVDKGVQCILYIHLAKARNVARTPIKVHSKRQAITKRKIYENLLWFVKDNQRESSGLYDVGCFQPQMLFQRPCFKKTTFSWD